MTGNETPAKVTTRAILITEPKVEKAVFRIRGTAPYMQQRFSQKAINAMKATMEAGSTAKKGTKREARDFQGDFEGAKHKSVDGWIGIPAASFRAAMISACRLVGFKMTLAKLSVFIYADGNDIVDGQPLVRIHGVEERIDMPVRNATGVFDIRARPMWREWYTDLVVEYDADQFSLTDVTNLLMRVGLQVGIGEGRPDSRNSAGMGYGTFKVESVEQWVDQM